MGICILHIVFGPVDVPVFKGTDMEGAYQDELEVGSVIDGILYLVGNAAVGEFTEGISVSPEHVLNVFRDSLFCMDPQRLSDFIFVDNCTSELPLEYFADDEGIGINFLFDLTCVNAARLTYFADPVEKLKDEASVKSGVIFSAGTYYITVLSAVSRAVYCYIFCTDNPEYDGSDETFPVLFYVAVPNSVEFSANAS